VLSQEHADVVEAQYIEAQQLGVVGTPTSFVDGIRVNGAVPEAVLDSLIAQALHR
jgi:protein-disulfide isomerase